MLIKCPECGKEVSDRAGACIHCGFPFTPFVSNNENEQNVETIPQEAAENADRFKIVLSSYTRKNAATVREKIGNVLGKSANSFPAFLPVPYTIVDNLSKSEADEIKTKFDRYHMFLQVVIVPQNEDALANADYIASSSTVRCPKCGSPAIGSGAHYLGATSWKTFNKCSKCGYQWKP